MGDKTEAEALRDILLTAANGEFHPMGFGQFAALPEGFKIHSLEAFQDRPNQTRADHKFVDVQSLASYLDRFNIGRTMICADYAQAHISAVIDGDTRDMPSHKTHRGAFRAVHSDILSAWLKVADKPMSQIEFGMFLEDRAIDVIQPEAAGVMDMVMTFDATKKVSFKSSQRLHDGQRQFHYVEENEARGAVTLPDHFIILAPVYRGMEPQKIKFMVRYRIEDGRLRFTVNMHDQDRVLREAFDRCVDALRVSLPEGHPIFVVG